MRDMLLRAGASPPEPGPETISPAMDGAGQPPDEFTTGWVNIGRKRAEAETYSRVGDIVPPLERYGLLRPLARLLGRVVFFLARLITVPQRAYNRAMVDALGQVGAALRDIEHRLRDDNAALERAGAALRHQEAALRDQETVLRDQEAAQRVSGERIQRLEERLDQHRRQAAEDRRRLDALSPVIETQDTRISALGRDLSALQAAGSARDAALNAHGEALRVHDREFAARDGVFQKNAERFHRHAARMDEIAEVLDDTRRELSRRDEVFQALDKRAGGLEESVYRERDLIAETRDDLAALRSAFIEHKGPVEEAIRGLWDTDSALREAVEQARAQMKEVRRLAKSSERRASSLGTTLALQEQRLTRFLSQAEARLQETAGDSLGRESDAGNGEGAKKTGDRDGFDTADLERFAKGRADMDDAVYLSFEDEFRGTREDIKDRQRVYLPMLRDHCPAGARAPLLDLGCGRGEWLELLKDEGFHAAGVDQNQDMVALCRSLQLDVQAGDLLAHLAALPAASLGAVTGFHVIEHLPVRLLLPLFDAVFRALQPGGMALFETPNPECLSVGAHTFYFDLTHRNPLPAPTIMHLAKSRGFQDIQVRHLHPFPQSDRLHGDCVLTDRLNDLLFGPRDYAIIAYKAGE